MESKIPHYDIDRYQNIKDAITSRNAAPTLPMLITFQLNRIDALRTLPMTADGNSDSLLILHAVKRGLRSIESKLSPYLKKEGMYYDEVKELKKYFHDTQITINNEHEYSEKLSEWEDILISYFGHLNLLPAVDKEWEFPE